MKQTIKCCAMILMGILVIYIHPIKAQENLMIRGQVISQENKQPLPGATIKSKATKLVIATDKDGNFSFESKSGDYISVSFTGFESKSFTLLKADKNLVVELLPSDHRIDEVQVVSTGYQKLPKERATGSFATIDNKELNRRPGENVLSRLEDMSAGLSINKTSTTKSQFNIRGQNTLFGGSKPLIIVDNFPYDGDLNAINPNDVESVTLLKDASAASIWGARAGNGVLVITTKKGNNDRAIEININSNLMIGGKRDLFYRPRISVDDYIDLEQELFKKGFYKNTETNKNKLALSPVVEMLILARDGKLSEDDAISAIAQYRQQDIRDDQLKYFERNSFASQVAFDISGGTKGYSYRASAGYDRALENQRGQEHDRYTVGLNNVYQLNSRLELGLGVNFVKTLTENNNVNFVPFYPYGRLKDESGNNMSSSKLRQPYILEQPTKGLLDWQYRPLDELALNDDNTNVSDYRINTSLKYKIWNGLSTQFLYNYTGSRSNRINNQHEESYFTRDLINRYTAINKDGSLSRAVPIGSVVDGYLSKMDAHNFRWQLDFQHKFAALHDLNAIGGIEVRAINSENWINRSYGYQEDTGKGILVDYLTRFPQYINPASSSQIPNIDDHKGNADRFLSYYMNAGYSYRNRYSLSASTRFDQSNLYGVKTNEKGVPLFSVGAAWTLSSEPFYSLDFLPYLKLRTTYGRSGNTSNFYSANIITSLANASSSPIGEPYAVVENPPNPSLRWEKMAMFNVGMDFAMKANRITGSIEYYTKRNHDLYGSVPYPYSTGVMFFKGNVASTKGNGLDLTINASILDRDIKWSATGLLSWTKDIVVDVPEQSISLGFLDGNLVPIKGKPLYGISSYRWAGLDPSNGDPIGYLNGLESKSYSKIISTATLENIVFNGSAIPLYYGSLRNTFAYRNFSLSFLISYRLGYFYHRESVVYGNNFGLGSTTGGTPTHGDYGKRWKAIGDELHTQVPSVPLSNVSGRDDFYKYSEVLVEKGDHIRFQDIRLDYMFSNKQNLPFRTMGLYAYANNIGLIWKANKQHIDPDYRNIPLPLTLSLGIKIGL
ncbi:SusC/RagA family TonB-linked outer membrane protein [Sphingobacterium siyangense]|uniref:SusC/RagA family TonB-linked outer membrane protein n=1 Tax=Sphingobacterium siyangense TaxID=459529 RepID=UPI003015ABD7